MHVLEIERCSSLLDACLIGLAVVWHGGGNGDFQIGGGEGRVWNVGCWMADGASLGCLSNTFGGHCGLVTYMHT